MRGTTSPEWIIGPGDIDVPGDEAIGIRVSPTTGELQKKEAGGTWEAIAEGTSVIEERGLLTTEGGIIYTPGTGNTVDLVVKDA